MSGNRESVDHESATPHQLTCPTCGMSASSNDYRQLRPIDGETRRCRNCGSVVHLTDSALTNH